MHNSVLVDLSGMLGLIFWVAGFALMLRLPWPERFCGGLDRLYWSHHVTGALAYVLLLVHGLAAGLPAALTGDWATAARLLRPPGETVALQAGWVALLLLMGMMAATFWLPLSYRRWRIVHLAVVPAFVLGWWHVWLMAGATLRSVLVMLGAVVIVALLVLHLLRRARIRAHAYRVVAVRHPGPGLIDVDLRAEGVPVKWLPGQFVFAAFGDGKTGPGCGEHHPYTVAGGQGGTLRLLIRDLGPCTHQLQDVQPGVAVRIEGPYGQFFARRDARRRQVWIAGGIGLTPFLAALEALVVRSQAEGGDMPVDLFHVHRPGEAGVRACLPEGMVVPAHVGLHELAMSAPTTDDLWARIAARVAEVGIRLSECQVYLCGPDGLVEGLRAQLLAAGVAPDDLHFERFDFR